MRRIVLVGCLLVAWTWVACQPPPDCQPTGVQTRTLRYRTTPGVPANDQSLDLSVPVRPAGCGRTPLVLYVHGGGFTTGDKANRIADKRRLFTGAGWAFASTNYRLADESTGAADGRYPAAERDLAAAVAFLRGRASTDRTDPDRLLLLGHSAGAFLVSLLATDGRHLGAVGLGLPAIACVASLDTSYDIPTEVAQGGRQAAMFRNAFGNDPAIWRQASPARNVAPGKDIADVHVVTRGTAHRVGEAADFVDALDAAGVPAELVVARGMTHEEVNAAVGAPGDTRITPALLRFYRTCGR